MARFWVYIGDKIQGPVDIPALRKIPGFNLLTQVCLEGEQTWRMADEVIEIKSYFISPPRLNSFTLDAGNAAPKLEQTDFKPALEELPSDTSPVKEKAVPTPAASRSASAGLREFCEACGYKNPRNLSVCMKCGEKLKGGSNLSAPSAVSEPVPVPVPVSISVPTPVSAPLQPTGPVATEVDIKASTMVEVPLAKFVMAIAAAALVAGGSFLGFQSWKKKHHVLPKSPAPVSQRPEAPPLPSAAPPRQSAKHYDHPPVRHRTGAPVAALPGVTPKADQEPAEQKPPTEKKAASYRVIAEATPLQKRNSSPLKSPYAAKRRADHDLWTTQEGQAIQQVQRTRIYGGQRTIQRNVEILMQILKDREYNTAFESGKRVYLYNDLDWSAEQKDGPLYEVRLTFSGGKEADGSPKKPLHFAFASDLERGTVEPGGQDQVRSNTLHAFFDESRIAPEDRRAIAKDTEELVLAAQPGASPLAFDTVVRQFAKLYGTTALGRVADAFDLAEVKRKLAHDPRLGTEETMGSSKPESKPEAAAPVQAPKREEPFKAAPAVEAAMPLNASQGGAIDFRMEKGSGRERTILVRTNSHASVERIWETLTGYDHLKQFVPDMLASEREGQDGAAAIVHVTCLTRFMFFVFKLNLHLRIIEHPQQHTLEFERIAGDYESLRGSIELATDPATHDSQIIFHATVVPAGYMTNTKLETMARRLLIPQASAIRAKAESN